MAEITLVNPNCNCCSGSGSGSGSCRCSIFDAGKALGECSTSSVKTACKTAFYLSVTLSYSQCSGLPIGSCGSAASGAETGLDGPETGSAQDCVVDCPSCCDLFDQSFEIPLVCYGDLIVSKNLVEGSPEYIECFGGSVIGLLPNGSYGSCLTHKKCPYFVFFSDGTGHLAIPIDHWILHFYFPGYDGGLTVNSCDPLQITINASAFCGDQVNDVSAPCLANCLGRNGWEYPSWIDQDLTLADVTFDCSCIKANMILTENSIGGGGGGGGGGPIL